MIYVIMTKISAFLILALWRWCKWKITALSTILFTVEKFREPTDEEQHYYVDIVIKKMLRIRNYSEPLIENGQRIS